MFGSHCISVRQSFREVTRWEVLYRCETAAHAPVLLLPLVPQSSAGIRHHPLSVFITNMPRKCPAKPVRQVYSRDLKRHVIYQAKVLGKLFTQIAIDLDMDLRVVQCVKQTWREIGDVCRDRKYKGRPPLMSSVEIDVRLI